MEENKEEIQKEEEKKELNNNQNQFQNYNNQNVNKNNYTILIAVIIILVVLIVVGGIYGFIEIKKMSKSNNEEKSSVSTQEKDQNKNNNSGVTENKNNNNTIIENKEKNNNTVVENKEKGSDTVIENKSNTNSSTAKESTIETPLKLGEWGIASKYVSKNVSTVYENQKGIDVPVRITKITRGESVNQEIKEWCENQSFYKYEDPKANTEWAIIEYEVDLTNVKFDPGSIGINKYVDSSIKGSDGLSLKYNGIIYVLSTYEMSDRSYVTKPDVYSCKFAVALPIGCTDYIISLGSSYYGSEAFFKCE